MPTISSSQTNSKAKVLEAYVILIVDILCIIASYYIAALLRYGNVKVLYRYDLYKIIFAMIIIFCLLYTTMVNVSKDFVKRGFLVEFIVVTKYNIIMIVVIGSALFMLKEADNFSRLFFMFFIITNQIIMLCVHILIKQYLKNHYNTSGRRLKTIIITDQECAEGLIKE